MFNNNFGDVGSAIPSYDLALIFKSCPDPYTKNVQSWRISGALDGCLGDVLWFASELDDQPLGAFVRIRLLLSVIILPSEPKRNSFCSHNFLDVFLRGING